MTLVLTALEGIPLVQEGDDLAGIILDSADQQGLQIEDGDIFVIAQKVVSKSEGRMVDLKSVRPTPRAGEIAAETGKDARFIELVLQESNEVLRTRPGTIIVEHKLGFVCANAGIDHSNVRGDMEGGDEWFLLLPKDPDGSAGKIRDSIAKRTGRKTGVLIIDSHGRAWRLGTVGMAIGVAGFPGLVDLRGTADLFGYTLQVTTVAVADELAAAASLIMGQAGEGRPIVHVRGFPYGLREGSVKELFRPKEMDMFR